jgi:hypothetical protein
LWQALILLKRNVEEEPYLGFIAVACQLEINLYSIYWLPSYRNVPSS